MGTAWLAAGMGWRGFCIIIILDGIINEAYLTGIAMGAGTVQL